MTITLDPRLQNIEAATSPEALMPHLLEYAHHLEFEIVTAHYVVERRAIEQNSPDLAPQDWQRKSHAHWFNLGNYPDQYPNTDPERSRACPVLAHCRVSNHPIIYTQETYVRAGVPDLWEQSAPYGFATGIAIPTHLPGGHHFLFGVDRSKPLPADTHKLSRLLASVTQMALYAQHSMARFARQKHIGEAQLTTREIECLRWMSLGKQAPDTAAILGIAPHTVRRHLAQSYEKLGCDTGLQAIQMLVRLGII